MLVNIKQRDLSSTQITNAKTTRKRSEDSLVLQQFICMSEQRDFRAQTVFTVGQITNVTAQLLLALSARLQLSL